MGVWQHSKCVFVEIDVRIAVKSSLNLYFGSANFTNSSESASERKKFYALLKKSDATRVLNNAANINVKRI